MILLTIAAGLLLLLFIISLMYAIAEEKERANESK